MKHLIPEPGEEKDMGHYGIPGPAEPMPENDKENKEDLRGDDDDG